MLSIAIDYKPHSVSGESFNYLAALADLSGFQNGEKACKVFKYLAALATACKSWQLFSLRLERHGGGAAKGGIPSDKPRKFLIIFKSFLINIPSERLPSCKLHAAAIFAVAKRSRRSRRRREGRRVGLRLDEDVTESCGGMASEAFIMATVLNGFLTTFVRFM